MHEYLFVLNGRESLLQFVQLVECASVIRCHPVEIVGHFLKAFGQFLVLQFMVDLLCLRPAWATRQAHGSERLPFEQDPTIVGSICRHVDSARISIEFHRVRVQLENNAWPSLHCPTHSFPDGAVVLAESTKSTCHEGRAHSIAGIALFPTPLRRTVWRVGICRIRDFFD